jgi:hypothetical protein
MRFDSTGTKSPGLRREEQGAYLESAHSTHNRGSLEIIIR